MLRNMGWRLFPMWLTVAMLMVAAVNAYMVYVAEQSFPGVAGADGFDLSNEYGRVLKTVAGQERLGWQLDATVDKADHPALRLAGPSGTPLEPARIDATAERPVGPKQTTALAFHDQGGGVYQAAETLHSGQWDVLLTVRANGHTYTTTRRLTVP